MQVKGLCHIHSKLSHDGEVSISELKESLKGKGFKFLLLTEHIHDYSSEKIEEILKECQSLSDEQFIIIPGLELEDKGEHFLAIGINESAKNIYDPIGFRSSGAIIVWAHPYKIKQDGIEGSQIDGLEIWNSCYDGKFIPRWQALKLLNKLRQENNVFAYGGIDFHRFSHLGGPFFVIDVEKLSEREILKSLKQGKFFIQRGVVAVNSDGAMQPGQKIEAALLSPIFRFLIGFFKFWSKILTELRISPPRKIKELIRSKL
jgi:vacuolar-type H+-ATPase subunit F/Vma7